MPLSGSAAVGEALSKQTGGAPTLPQESVEVRVDAWIVGATPREPATNGEARPDVELETGKSYIVKVTLTARSSQRETIALEGDTKIKLMWEGAPCVRFLDDPQQRSPADLVYGRTTLDFRLVVEGQAPLSEGVIRLYAGVCRLVRYPEPLLRVAIGGKYHMPPPELETKARVKLAADPSDPRFAILHVFAAGNQLGILGWHAKIGRFDAVIPQPDTSLAVADGKQSFADAYLRIVDYNQHSIGKLIKWLDDVLKATEDRVSIVIAEYTDSRVPWEMLTLDGTSAPLGARVQITRWTEIQFYADQVTLDLQEQYCGSGSVVRFVDESRLKNSQVETNELVKCKQLPCSTVEKLGEILRNPPGNVAVVFMACHGIIAKDKEHETVELVDAANPSKNITLLSLAGLQRPKSQPTLIVNACHSGRLVRGRRGISGLPEVFLSSFSKAFLGTLGAVREEVAAEVGADLLKEARSAGGLRIPDFLLRLRRQAAERFDTDTMEEAWRFVSYFMYVYYGPLDACVRIESA